MSRPDFIARMARHFLSVPLCDIEGIE